LRYLIHLLAVVFLLAGAEAQAAQGPSYIVVDVDSGMVILDRNSNAPWYPASITKLMTAYVTFKALKAGRVTLASTVTESQNAQNEPPSKMGFKVGTTMDLDNALKMMLVHSANDIAVAVAESVGGSEPAFVQMMNAEARRLGMYSTHFQNPNGLPADGHVTTARDIAVLARALWLDYPDVRAYVRIPAIKAGRRVLRSQNYLLEHYRGTNGMKTGFICASGFNMVASATRSGHTLMAVVLGATSAKERAETAATLLDRGFQTIGYAVNRPKLEAFNNVATFDPPADMKPLVCGKRAVAGEGEDDPVLGDSSGSSLLPRFVLMDPVPVFTRQVPAAVASTPAAPGTVPAKAAPSKPIKVGGKKVPAPRLRPGLPGEPTASAFAPTGSGGSPIDLQVAPPPVPR
jgi:D-alanyl-D-alanine carboxypeptidase